MGYAKVTDKGYLMDKRLCEYLDIFKRHVLTANMDCELVFDGSKRSGKTTLAGQCAYYLDPDYCINNVVFSTEQFIEFSQTAKPGSVVHWDESVLGASGGHDSITKESRKLRIYLDTIGSKRLIIFYVQPRFRSLRDDIFLNCKALVHSRRYHDVKKDLMMPGRFSYYKSGSLEYLHYALQRSKEKPYNYVKPRHIGDFKGGNQQFTKSGVPYSDLFYTEKEYEEKKQKALIEFNDKSKSNVLIKVMNQRNVAIKLLYDNRLLMGEKRSEIITDFIKKFSVTRRTITSMIKEIRTN